MVACYLGVVEAAGSNPVVPILPSFSGYIRLLFKEAKAVKNGVTACHDYPCFRTQSTIVTRTLLTPFTPSIDSPPQKPPSGQGRWGEYLSELGLRL